MFVSGESLRLWVSGLFIMAFIPVFTGGIMYMGRNQLKWEIGQSRSYLYWERSMWMGGMLVLALGMALFAKMLQTEGENIFAQLGLTNFQIGAVIIIVVEGYVLDTQIWSEYLIKLSVLLLLSSQAILGVSILQVEPLAQWLGWIMIVWGLGWLTILIRAKDPYYPMLYYFMPLIIGIFLLRQAI